MCAFSALTRYAQARRGFAEEDIWRDALGGPEPLRVFVTDGPIDAPDWIPAGSTRRAGSRCAEPWVTVTKRPE